MDQENIIKVNGADWKHKFIYNLIKGREFPTRLRIINLARKIWIMDLLKYTTPSGLKLVLDVTDWVQSQIFYHGNYEKKSIKLFKQLAKEAKIIFDIGAHIGQYALECAIEDTSAKKTIFAIEVNPKTFTYLINNIKLNNFQNVKAVLGAVGSSENIADITIPAYWNMGNTMIASTKAHIFSDSYLSATLKINELLTKYHFDRIDLVKLDVEGQEIKVIKDLFSNNLFPSHIIFEYIPKAFEHASSLIGVLEEHGYTIKDINGNYFTGEGEIEEQNLWATRI